MCQEDVSYFDFSAVDMPENDSRLKNDVIEKVIPPFGGRTLHAFERHRLRRCQFAQPGRLTGDPRLKRPIFLLQARNLRLERHNPLAILVPVLSAGEVEELLLQGG